MRVLDLGCGPGCDLTASGVSDEDDVIGLDIDIHSLREAREQFPTRRFLQGLGERLPFEDECFERVVSSVAIPYMRIEEALPEISRVLTPGGTAIMSLHLPSFTLSELIHDAFPHPIAVLYRIYVLMNGMWFHWTGKTMRFLKRRTESCQTVRGMLIALRHAGFVCPSFSLIPAQNGTRFVVKCAKA